MTDSDEEIVFRAQGIDHVELFVPARWAAANWYRRVLGLEVVADCERWADDPEGPLMISSDGGGTKLALFRSIGRPLPAGGAFRRVAFRTDGGGFRRFLELLPELGLEDSNGHAVEADALVDHDTAVSIYFADPYGNQLELTTYDRQRALAG